MVDPVGFDEHCRVVRRLYQVGQALAPGAATATVHNPAWFVSFGGRSFPTEERKKLHDRLISEAKDNAPGVAQQRLAIVLAGPPGAGKSTFLDSIVQESRSEFLVVDADDFKRALLRQAVRDGSYESWIKPDVVRELEGAGEVFFPLELASLVHEESSALAKRLRSEAVASGTNVVVDSVLSWEQAATDLGQQLDSAGYNVQVVDVEVPFEVSQARIARRWKQSYQSALDSGDDLGGRWVPSDYVHDVFDGPNGKSKPEAFAEKLAVECPTVRRYRLYRTTTEGTDSGPAVASLEKDLSRSRHGSALLET